MVEAFLPFDLEAVFISSISLLAGCAIEKSLIQDNPAWLHKAYAILDDLCDSGNLLAKQQKNEVRSFEQALTRIKGDNGMREGVPTVSPTAMHSHGSSSTWQTGVAAAHVTQSFASDTPAPLPHESQTFGFENLDDLFTSAYILDTANAIDTEDAEWMTQAMTQYNLW